MIGLKPKIERTVVSLKIISKLEEQDKLLFRNRNVFIQSPSILTSIQRFINGDGRENTIFGINQLLEDVESLLIDCRSSASQGSTHEKYVSIHQLYVSVSASMKGYEILKMTYAHDQVMRSHLEYIIEKFRLLSMEFGRLADDMRTSSLDNIIFVDE